ncbi:MAG TPA: hypothetical protein VLX90_06885, partial [Steroidobacteraceae bacterium]|nr:hypothetical protein [Steroidobacteraceae bacterium]
ALAVDLGEWTGSVISAARGTSVFLMSRSGIAFAALAWRRNTARMNKPRSQPMKASTVAALLVGILLTAAQFLAIYYDARHGVARYRGGVTTALPVHR